MAITSPPYWQQRDYHVEGQLGLEASYEEYITKLCDVFDEVRRVLRYTTGAFLMAVEAAQPHERRYKRLDF